MTQNTREFWAGVRAEAPILAGTIPFGLIYGVSAVGAGVPANVSQAMSAIIFGGSSQFVAARLIGAHVPGLLIILTGFIINLRHALYSASVAPYLQHLPRRWKWLLAYLMVDEAYAVAIIHYQRPTPVAAKHWYFLGAGLVLWICWQTSTFVGVFLGAQVPASWSLDFTLALTFIALVVPAIRDRAGLAAASVAGVVAVLALKLPYQMGLIVATAAGIAVGMLVEQWDRRATAATEDKPELPSQGELSP